MPLNGRAYIYALFTINVISDDKKWTTCFKNFFKKWQDILNV